MWKKPPIYFNKYVPESCATKDNEVEIMVWRLTMQLDPGLLDQTSIYIDKNRSEFVVSLPAEW